MKMDFAELLTARPDHPASKLIRITEDQGGSIRKPSYDGMHLLGPDGKVFALLKNVKENECSLYLHSTSVPQAQKFAQEVCPEWVNRLVLDKKGYAPARLTGITSEEVTPSMVLAVKALVLNGIQTKASKS